jgi:hypothetical protein
LECGITVYPAVERNVVEVRGRLYLEAAKNRKHRRTIYPAARRSATCSPNAWRPLTALSIERAGFEGVYIWTEPISANCC